VQNTPFSTNKTLNINGRLIELNTPRIMGVLNVTPDSFFDGGKYSSETAIVTHSEKMLSEGADFIDIGGYSSRPGAADISLEEECHRVVSTIDTVLKNFPGTIISVDTFRSRVAEAAVDAGAVMINDIAGGNLDPEMLSTVSRLRVPYIVMHMKGNPQNMKEHSSYNNLMKELIDYFHYKIDTLRRLDVKDIVIDPGFGFAKSIAQNFTVLNNLEKLSILGKPVLVGLSRKSLIWKSLKIDPEHAMNGTTALNAIALLKGADILRVHDVKEAKEVVKLYTSLQVNVST
jgi:dihydropteroate synthase